MPPTGSCCLALQTALLLLARILSGSLNFPVADMAIVVVVAFLSLSALSKGCVLEGEEGNQPVAGRVGTCLLAQRHRIEERSFRIA